MRFCTTFLIFCLIWITGCASTKTLDVSERSRSYEGITKSQYIQAALNYFNFAGIPVENVDSDLGIINTEYTYDDNRSAWQAERRMKINLSINELEQSIRVVGNILYEAPDLFTGWSRANLSRDRAIEMYNNMFKEIEKYLD